MKYLKVAEKLGTVQQEVIPIKPKRQSLTPFERNKAICCLTEIYNPVRQKEFAKQFFDHVVDKIKVQFIPDGQTVILTERLHLEVLMFKDQIVRSLITGHKYYNTLNKNFMDMLDVQVITEMNKIVIQPNSPLEVLMHGVAPVTFFVGDNSDNIEELWEKHKHEFK